MSLFFRCPKVFYAFDSQLSNRKTSFGYGSKYDFTTPLNVSPPSTKYNSKSFTDDSKKKGKTFGTSREISPDKSYLIPQIHKHPGPANVYLRVIFSMAMKSTNKRILVIL